MAFPQTGIIDTFAPPTARPSGFQTGDKYVSTGGSDANNGDSTATPYATMQKGYDNVPAGKTVWIRGGTYTQAPHPSSGGLYGLYCQAGSGGSSGSPKTICNYPNEVVTISTVGMYCNTNWVNIVGQDDGTGGEKNFRWINYTVPFRHDLSTDCILEDLRLTNGHRGATRIWGSGTNLAQRITDRRLIVHDNGNNTGPDHGIYGSHSNNCVAENCIYYKNDNTVGGLGGRGIHFYPDCDNCVAKFCTCDENGGGITSGGSGAAVSDSDSYFYNICSTCTNRAGLHTNSPYPTNGVATGTHYWNNSIADADDTTGLTRSLETTGDPLYANRLARDYRLGAGSPAIGKGFEWRFLPSTNWSFYGTGTMLRCIHDCVAVPLNSGPARAVRNSAAYGPSVEGYITLAKRPGQVLATGDYVELRLKQDGTTATQSIAVRLTINAAGNDTLEIKRNGTLQGANDTTQDFTIADEGAASEALGLEMDGTTVTVFRRTTAGVWSQVFQRTGVTELAATTGNPAIEAQGPHWRIDALGGGGIAVGSGGGGSPPPPPPASQPDTMVAPRALGTIPTSGFIQPSDIQGFQHTRKDITLAAGASGEVTLDWQFPIGATTYSAFVSIHEATAAENNLRVERIVTKSSTQIVVRVTNTAAATRTGTVQAMAFRDHL